MIHEAEHVRVIPYLAIAGWVLEVWFLVGDLVEHAVYEEEEASVFLDEIFKIFDDGVERSWVIFHVGDCIGKPLLVNAVVCREPPSGSGRNQLT
jgi:hypothetical protein